MIELVLALPAAKAEIVIIPVPGVPPIVVRFVIVDNGKEFRGIVFSPQEAMTVVNGRSMN